MNILISLISNFNLFISNPTPPIITTPDSSNNDGTVLSIIIAIGIAAILCAIPILIAVYSKLKRNKNYQTKNLNREADTINLKNSKPESDKENGIEENSEH